MVIAAAWTAVLTQSVQGNLPSFDPERPHALGECTPSEVVKDTDALQADDIHDESACGVL